MSFAPTENWSAICKKCHRHFYFGETYVVTFEGHYSPDYYKPINSIVYPEGTLEKITIICPFCVKMIAYDNAELLRPSEIVDRERKLRENSSSSLKSQIEALEAKVSGLEAENAQLRENNSKLTEDNRILAHVIEDDRRREGTWKEDTQGGQQNG